MATSLVRDVILRDGSVLRLRSPQPEDEAAIKVFFDALAPESRYMRFHGAGRTDTVSRNYAQADGDTRVSLLARLGERVVAVAGYDRLNEPGVAEVAFAVADDMQGRGLATRMLEQLAEVGSDRGVRRFDAGVMSDNRRMLGVFSSAGFDIRRESAFGEAHLELDIRPSERHEERVAEHDHRLHHRLSGTRAIRPAGVAPPRRLRAGPGGGGVVRADARRWGAPARVGHVGRRAVGDPRAAHPGGGAVHLADGRHARPLGDRADLAVLRHPRQRVIRRRGLAAAAPGPVRVHLPVAALRRNGHGAS